MGMLQFICGVKQLKGTLRIGDPTVYTCFAIKVEGGFTKSRRDGDSDYILQPISTLNFNVWRVDAPVCPFVTNAVTESEKLPL
jgi:hypothetical protein